MAMKIHWTDGRKALHRLSQLVPYGQPVTYDEARRLADDNRLAIDDDKLRRWVDTHNGQPDDPFEGLTR